MRTRNLTKTTLCLAGATLIAATSASFASTVSFGKLTPFTGGDAGEGLDLSGNIIYAFNLGGTAQTVQGVTFIAADRTAPPVGITTTGTAANQFNYSTANPGGASGANYGASANDIALGSIVNTVWYDSNWTFDVAVELGAQYEVQLIHQESFFPFQGEPARNFDVSVETAFSVGTTLAVDELVLGEETNGANSAGADAGLVYSYSFTATDNSFRMALDDSPTGADGNAILAAVTLRQVPEPSTFALFGISFLGLFLRRSR